MFQTTAKLWSAHSCFEVNAHKHGNPCFRAWPTYAMFDYFQNEIFVSAEDKDNSSEKPDRDQRKEEMETIRAELQDLLRSVHEEVCMKKEKPN